MSDGPEPECNFPTIADLADRMADLVAQGLGAFPVQIVVVPDSTLQAIAKMNGYAGTKPALMAEMVTEPATPRLPVCVISADRLSGNGGMPSLKPQ